MDAGTLTLSGDFPNFAGTTLTGGRYRVTDAGTLRFTGANVVTNAAIIELGGPGSRLLNSSNGADALAGFAVNAAGAAFAISDGRNFTSAGAFDNGGLVTVGPGSTFTAAGTFTNSGAALIELTGGTLAAPSLVNAAGIVQGFGTVAAPLDHGGAVFARGGTLSFAAAVQGAGALTVDPGASLVMGAPSSAALVHHAGLTLVLGAGDLTVSADYDNAAFGSGNQFAPRAGVSGSGQIIGQGVALAVGGDATPAGADTWVLNFGNVRGGGSATRSFTVVHAGSGAALRTALQNAANGANVDDPRLSGPGLVDINLAPLAAGQSSAPLQVTLTADSARGGDLAGQALAVAGNFGNVATQRVLLQAFTTKLAQGSAAPAGLLDLGSFRVGATPPVGAALQLSNTTTGAGAERLGLGALTTTGEFTATDHLGGAYIAPGASQAGAVTVASSGAGPGVNEGSVSLQFVSNGQPFDGSFSDLAVNQQTVQLRATGFRLANPIVDTSPIVLAARVGDAAPSRIVAVSNSSPDLYTERLDAGIATAAAGFNATGSVTGLAAGASSNALAVSLATGTAGAYGGQADVSLVSSGVGTTSAPDAGLPGAAVPLSGRVWAPAVAQVPGTVVDFGIVRVGDSVAARGVTVANTGSGALTDTLRATVAGGGVPFTVAGEVVALAAGAVDADSITVGLATGNAGLFSGGAALAFTSRNGDLADLDLGSVALTLQAQVNRLAEASLAHAGDGAFSGGGTSYTLDFGTLVEGSGLLGAALVLANMGLAPADSLSGDWDLSAIPPGDAFALSGFVPVTELAPGDALSGLSVSFAAAAIGVYDRTVVLRGWSVNGSGPDLALGDLSLRLRGQVVAIPEPDTYALMAGGLALLMVAIRRRRVAVQRLAA